jgi:hypothetical protein
VTVVTRAPYDAAADGAMAAAGREGWAHAPTVVDDVWHRDFGWYISARIWKPKSEYKQDAKGWCSMMQGLGYNCNDDDYQREACRNPPKTLAGLMALFEGWARFEVSWRRRVGRIGMPPIAPDPPPAPMPDPVKPPDPPPVMPLMPLSWLLEAFHA